MATGGKEQKDPTLQDNEEEEEMKKGPMNLLYGAVRDRNQLLIHCRHNRKLLARIKMFDRHMNMVLEGVEEIWSDVPKTGKGKKKGKTLNRHRFIPKMMLRGDSVILVVKNPLGLPAQK
eukprot:NODE_9074_length_489_cov_20.404545_g8000_i0.p1 GENE.NODE_9074_length_489_cov_20.404545_g8000_i0~~NODE_9074_length_489_cov_20.404545_g8000_i0.p1  ORF type:complete len:119 (+),score=40.32 NODE_9074_length_489_cov_20.404545_g8000_i0:79-435(+)